MEQMMACPLPEMKAMQQKMETNHERMKAKMDAFQPFKKRWTTDKRR
jgi:hypothetical protein